MSMEIKIKNKTLFNSHNSIQNGERNNPYSEWEKEMIVLRPLANKVVAMRNGLTAGTEGEANFNSNIRS